MSNQVTLLVTVAGADTNVKASAEARLSTVIAKALEQTKNTGRPPSDWVLKDAAGNPLDITQKIESFNFGGGAHLYLSLQAGGGGR